MQHMFLSSKGGRAWVGLKICAKFFLKIPPSITMYYDIIKDDVLDLECFRGQGDTNFPVFEGKATNFLHALKMGSSHFLRWDLPTF